MLTADLRLRLPADAKFPGQTGDAIPPSPTRENPAQVYPKSEPTPAAREPAPVPSPKARASPAQQQAAQAVADADREAKVDAVRNSAESGGMFAD
ncbi:hypothetical protein FA95DRAFT_1603222 [Auriscalpium vulgare]|uniref:Uncharacterized protein n=1 Tax=Auriscalpium vulgare TaxID=40419 RepID=A0ACB8S2U2_9AGAM|nr:hypothetical protein FA95DRAFT_1603222 [Auriscalpium vulgare]